MVIVMVILLLLLLLSSSSFSRSFESIKQSISLARLKVLLGRYSKVQYIVRYSKVNYLIYLAFGGVSYLYVSI